MHVFKDLHLESSILTNIMNRVIARGNTLNLQNQEEVLEFFSFFVFWFFLMVVSFAKHTVLYLLLFCEDAEIALVMELNKTKQGWNFYNYSQLYRQPHFVL